MHLTDDNPDRRRVVLVGIDRADTEISVYDGLEELSRLALTAGMEVVSTSVFRVRRVSPSAFIGSGQIRDLAAKTGQTKATTIVVDRELSPVQQNNLSSSLNVEVIDRTWLILMIFAMRAKSREGRIQVELAQLRYLFPRLVGRGRALSRLGGGAMLRGPGETKLETDRRRMRKRISRLKKDLARLKRHRQEQKRRRRKTGVPVCALTGYTNAGKSTLFNRLSGADAHVENRLFATLDPQTRKLNIEGFGDVLLSDTVGFVRSLPTHLVAAFSSTLEEVAEADVVCMVADAAMPGLESRLNTVNQVLNSLGSSAGRRMLVLNKCDRLNSMQEKKLRAHYVDGIFISARHRTGFESLTDAICIKLMEPADLQCLLVPYSRMDLLDSGHVGIEIIDRCFENDHVKVHAKLSIDAAKRLSPYIMQERT